MLRSAYTGRLPADLSHATRMNMGKSSVIVYAEHSFELHATNRQEVAPCMPALTLPYSSISTDLCKLEMEAGLLHCCSVGIHMM